MFVYVQMYIDVYVCCSTKINTVICVCVYMCRLPRTGCTCVCVCACVCVYTLICTHSQAYTYALYTRPKLTPTITHADKKI